MHARRLSVTVTTDAAEAATVYLPSAAAVAAGAPHLNGRVLTLIYTKDDFTNGVDFTITGEASGETIWTEANVDASKTVAPRQATHSTAGRGVAATPPEPSRSRTTSSWLTTASRSSSRRAASLRAARSPRSSGKTEAAMPHGIVLVTAPAVEPVTLAEVKQQIGIPATNTNSDAIINQCLLGAREFVEALAGPIRDRDGMA
jgi:hypothetical protein